MGSRRRATTNDAKSGEGGKMPSFIGCAQRSAIPFVVNSSDVLREEGCEREESSKRCGNDTKNLTRNADELVG